jgi:hypothetical protein
MGTPGMLSGRPRLTRPAVVGTLAAAVLIVLGVLTSQGARSADGEDSGVPVFPPSASTPA